MANYVLLTVLMDTTATIILDTASLPLTAHQTTMLKTILAPAFQGAMVLMLTRLSKYVWIYVLPTISPIQSPDSALRLAQIMPPFSCIVIFRIKPVCRVAMSFSTSTHSTTRARMPAMTHTTRTVQLKCVYQLARACLLSSGTTT